MTDLIFGTTGGAAFIGRSLAERLATGENVLIIDPKAQVTKVSRGAAKKRLRAAGLKASEANWLVRELVGKTLQGMALRAAMRHHKRHGKTWFPWDAYIR